MKHKFFFNWVICLFLLSFLTHHIASAQAAKPRIMVFPANVWMKENNFVDVRDNQGKPEDVFDYQKALNNSNELYSVVNKLSGLMSERGFPLNDLAQELKNISFNSALNSLDENKKGSGLGETARDKLLKTARPDIILEIYWKVTTIGPKKSVSFDLKGIDAGTGKVVASANGPGTPSFSAQVDVLLAESVISHLDAFNAGLMNHFTDMFENGREITLDVKVWEDSPKKLNDEINEDGDELKDEIRKFVKDNSVKGRYVLAASSPTFMTFSPVRIPLFDAEGAPMDADMFAEKLKKHLRKNFKLEGDNYPLSLSRAEVLIGGKRQ
jgi:hypothetical protein